MNSVNGNFPEFLVIYLSKCSDLYLLTVAVKSIDIVLKSAGLAPPTSCAKLQLLCDIRTISSRSVLPGFLCINFKFQIPAPETYRRYRAPKLIKLGKCKIGRN